MKKMTAFIIFFISLFIISCASSKERELKKLFNATSVDVSVKKGRNDADIELLNLVRTKEGVQIKTTSYTSDYQNMSFIIDKDNYLFIDLGIGTSYLKLEESEEIDVYNYISNIKETEDKLTFDFNMNSFTNVHDFWLDQFIPIDEKLKFTCEFNEGKIISLDYVVGKVRVIFQINGYSNKENVKEIEIPKKEECGYITEDDFYNHLSQVRDLDINNCKLITNGRIINAYVNEKVELNVGGGIYYKGSIIKHIEQEDLYIEDVVFSEKGEYKVKVYTKYLGLELSTEVTAVVEKRVDSKNSYKVNELKSIAYGFTIDENTYLCDERYIYKFDKECKTLYGKLDLQCQGNCHYVKDGYLYVSANFPYLSTYNGEYGYYGSVTKINLTNFTIDKQVPIRSYPISIIVDNNDNVIISKGANQHVYNEVVNMDTGELSKAFFGYQGDFLLYDSKQDIIINVTRTTTNNNEIYKYNGQTWDYVGDSSIKCDEVYYYDNNMIVTDKGVYKYNESTNDYTLTKFYFNDNINYLEVLYATSDGEKAYVVLGKDINTPKKIYTLDLESGIYSNIVLVDEQINPIKFTYSHQDNLYVVYESGVILKVECK